MFFSVINGDMSKIQNRKKTKIAKFENFINITVYINFCMLGGEYNIFCTFLQSYSLLKCSILSYYLLASVFTSYLCLYSVKSSYKINLKLSNLCLYGVKSIYKPSKAHQIFTALFAALFHDVTTSCANMVTLHLMQNVRFLMCKVRFLTQIVDILLYRLCLVMSGFFLKMQHVMDLPSVSYATSW